jgi:hypothetical protein
LWYILPRSGRRQANAGAGTTGVLLVDTGGKITVGVAAVALVTVLAFGVFADGAREPAPADGRIATGQPNAVPAAASATAGDPVDDLGGEPNERRELDVPALLPLPPVAFTVLVRDADSGQPVECARVEVVARRRCSPPSSRPASGCTLRADAGSAQHSRSRRRPTRAARR